MQTYSLESISLAFNKPDLNEEDLQQSLLVLNNNSSLSEQRDKVMDVRRLQSIKINHLFLHSNLLINGVNELQFFWNFLFDWSIQPNLKANLEMSFTNSLVQWRKDYHRIFQSGLEKSIELFKRRIQFQCNQETILSANLQLSNSEYQFPIQMKYDSNTKNIFKTLQFITKCCFNTLKFYPLEQDYFKQMTKQALKLLNISMSVLTPIQTQLSIIQTLNMIIDTCLEMKISNQQRMRCIEDICNTTDLQQLMMIVYNIGANDGMSKDKEISWIVLELHNSKQQLQYIQNKIDIAQVHLKYIFAFDDNHHFNLHFLSNQSHFLRNLLYSIYSFTTISKNYCHYELKEEFVSYLLQIYFDYLFKNPAKLQKIQHLIIKNILIPLLTVKTSYYEQILIDDPSQFLHYLEEATVQQQTNTATVKAAKLLRIFTDKKQIKNKLVKEVLLKLENSNNNTDFFFQEQTNYETIWLTLVAITPKMQQQEQFIRHILSVLSNNKQLFVSNIGLCIIVYFMYNLQPKYHKQAQGIANNLQRQIIQRQNKQLFIFLFELLSEQQCWINSLYLLQSSYRMLKKQINAREMDLFWKLFDRSIRYYLQTLKENQLHKIVDELLRPKLKLLHKQDLSRICVFSLYHCLKTIHNLLKYCNNDQIIIIQPCFLEFSELFQKIMHYGFQQELLHTIIQYFSKISKLKTHHRPFITIILQQLYKKSFAQQQFNQSYLTFCKSIINIQFEQQSIYVLLLISSTIIQNAKYYNMDNPQMKCKNTEEQIYKSLFILQEIIHILAEDIPKQQIDNICKIFRKWSKIQDKRLYLRMVNVLISCRIYCIPRIFCWYEVESMVIQCEVYIVEAQRLIKNIQKLLQRNKPIRSPKDYAFILNILYKIVQKYEQKQPQNITSLLNDKLLQSIQSKIYQIFTTIFKRKRLVFDMIKQSFTLKSSTYYQQLSLQLQKQSSKAYPLQYLSMIF